MSALTQQGEPILELRNLAVEFHVDERVIEAVRGVSFSIPPGRTTALLGESGCGKSVAAMAILRLIQRPGILKSGEIIFRGSNRSQDLAGLDPNGSEIRAIRGREIAMIFQEPRESLTPVYSVGNQIAEAILLHEDVSPAEARRRAIELLAAVGIPAPERRVDEYPYQLSGGMCQRAMIAMALACNPKLLIADEPTTALDVTIQAQVLDLMREIQRERAMSILLITHDMGVVAEMADEVVVMYLGKIMECGPVEEIFDDPKHPYTRGLFRSVPSPNSDPTQPLPRIRGSVPDASRIPSGCPFRGRCDHEMPVCREMPPLERPQDCAPTYAVACWLHSRQSEKCPSGANL